MSKKENRLLIALSKACIFKHIRKFSLNIIVHTHSHFCSFFSHFEAHTVGGASPSERNRRCGGKDKNICNRGPVLHFFSLYLLIFLISCNRSNEPNIEIRPDNTTHFIGNAMTMKYHIIIGKPLENNEIAKINNIILTTFQETNSVFNKWNPDSELSRLNSLRANIKVPLSPALENLLKQIQLIVELSDGRFDPTIEPLQRLWKAKLQSNKEPTPSEIANVAPAIGWDKIHFGNGSFSKSHDLTELDLGGIAKGLCIDLIIERLYDLNFKDTYVEWGGEISCRGQHPDKRLWTVFISRLGNTFCDG